MGIPNDETANATASSTNDNVVSKMPPTNDADKHDEMKEHFKTLAENGQFDTKNIKFNWDELQKVMKDRIAKGDHSFEVSFAAYQNEDHAKDYAEKHGVNPADVVGKVTLLVKNDDGTHSEIAKICPPPVNCGEEPSAVDA